MGIFHRLEAADPSMAESGPFVFSRYAWWALAILFTINLFNYIDRQILFGIFPLIQQDLGLNDAALGLLGSAFMVLYMVASIPLGVLGDRWHRPRVITGGVAIWGIATFFSGIAGNFQQLFVTRALVGLGEASYGPTATAMISDYFPKARRGFVNSLFTSAIPLGGALGVALGGIVGSRFGWRAAFFLVGVPSLVLAGLAWRLRDPPRGASDQEVATPDDPVEAVVAAPAARPRYPPSEILNLFRIPTFVMICLVGMLVAFAAGAFAAWLPTYLFRVKKLSLPNATLVYGLIQAGGGFLGVVLGGFMGDVLMRRTRAGHLITISLGFLFSAPCGVIFLRSPNPYIYLPAMFLAVFFLLLYTGSVNAVIHNVVQPDLRATAIAIFVFLIHLGGDAFSPAVVGLISDRRSLQGAMLILPFVVFFAGLLALAASTVVAMDMRRMEREMALRRIVPRQGGGVL